MFSSQNCASEQTCEPSSADAEPCSLQILSQFERFYQGRIAEIEANVKITEAQRNELKLKIMTDWIRDLGEQNTMLVQIVHDLEQATVDRVKLLENKLQETSNVISYNMTNSDKPEEDLNALSSRLCELVQEQDSMKTKIDFLHKDIDSLLELIKRGRIENNWNLEGITFFAIQPSDIPTPAECTCGQIPSLKNCKESSTIGKELELRELNKNLFDNDTRFNKHEYECKINELQIKIQEKCRDNEKLKKCYAILEKESVESRKALAEEVAQKHDSIIVLKNKIHQLEDELGNLKGSIAFRDELIQQLKNDSAKSANHKKLNFPKPTRVRCTPKNPSSIYLSASYKNGASFIHINNVSEHKCYEKYNNHKVEREFNGAFQENQSTSCQRTKCFQKSKEATDRIRQEKRKLDQTILSMRSGICPCN